MSKLSKINGILERMYKEARWVNPVDLVMFVKDILWRIYREARWLNLVKIALFGEEASLEWMPQLVIHLNICLYHSFYSFLVLLFIWSILLFMSRTARQLTQGTELQGHKRHCYFSQL